MQKSLKAAGINRKQLDAFIKKETADAEVFAINFEAAREEWQEVITAEITRRAITGVPRDIYHQGMVVGTETIYSDTLLARMAEAVVPEYSKKLAVSMDGPMHVVIKTFGTTQEDLH